MIGEEEAERECERRDERIRGAGRVGERREPSDAEEQVLDHGDEDAERQEHDPDAEEEPSPPRPGWRLNDEVMSDPHGRRRPILNGAGDSPSGSTRRATAARGRVRRSRRRSESGGRPRR